MAGFSVKIGANAVQLTKTLGELQKDLTVLKKQLSKTLDASEVIRLNAAIAQTEKQIKSISGAQSLNALNASLKQLPPGANQATTALGNLGRVASDAPFGFIAISNNIEPLLQSFVYLKQQSGSTGAAIKALGSSLIGGGGLILLFSLATSAATFFAASAGHAKKELQGFAKAQADSNKEAGEEIAHLKVLAAVAANTSNVTKERKEAAEQLTKALKANNVQLSEEEILNNKAAKAIDLATQAILARARARAIENRVAELSAGNLDREIKREDLNKRLAESQKKLTAEQEKARKAGRLLVSDIQGRQALQIVEGITSQVKVLDKETAKATEEINKLLTRATAAPDGGGNDKVVDLLKKRIEALQKLRTEAGLTRDQQIELAQLEIQLIKRDSIKLGFTPAELQQRINAAIENAFPGERLTSRLRIQVLGEIDSSIPDLTPITAEIANQGKELDISAALGLDKIDPSKLNAVVKALQEAGLLKKQLLATEEAEEFAGFITDKLGPVFTDLFANITSDGQNAFKAFIKAIGDLIKRLIAAAIAAVALSAILNAIFPGLGGKASFKAIFGSLTGLKFADGGIVSRPTLGVFGEAGPEAVIPLSRLPQIIGSAQGNGGPGGEFTARIVDGGRDLILIMQQANKTFGRNF